MQEQQIQLTQIIDTATNVEHLITTMSSLVALFAHANTQNYSPAAREMIDFINNSSIPKDPILQNAITNANEQIQSIYHFDQEEVQQKAFPKVENRRLAGMEAVINQKPDILIDLGCGSGPFLLDILKTKTNKIISMLGLDFGGNIKIANIFLEELYPQYKDSIEFYSTDLLNFMMLRAIFGIYIKSLDSKTRDLNNKKLCFYNQGLFRYLPKDKQAEFAKIIYEITNSYPGKVVWIQTDNEILGSSSDISKLNHTESNIFKSETDMFETFSDAGWNIDFDYYTKNNILLLTK